MLRIPARERKKADPVSKEPFDIKTVFDHGTVLLDTGAAEYRTNIRRIFPWFSQSSLRRVPMYLVL
ncbi:hypothetical protein PC123_g5619 [Phytophthora cactorum]|nr:hypothetical protein PC123_g5619 [Phytophthora cactorum]